MKFNFEEAYDRYDRIAAEKSMAFANNDEVRFEKLEGDMETIYSEAEAALGKYSVIFEDYVTMRDSGNNYIDLSRTIDEIRVTSKITEILDDNGLEYFTVNGMQCVLSAASFMEDCATFTENGCRLEGLVTIKAPDFYSPNGIGDAPALLFKTDFAVSRE